MANLRYVILFLLGSVFGAFLASIYFNYSRPQKEDRELYSPLEIAQNLYSKERQEVQITADKGDVEGGEQTVKAFLSSTMSLAFYNPDSGCIIDIYSTGDFNEKAKGDVANVRMVVMNFSNQKAKVACVKEAMESAMKDVLHPSILAEIRAQVAKTGLDKKIYSDTQIKRDSIDTPLFDDSTFKVKKYSGSIFTSPTRFELTIMDCDLVKCY